MTTLLFYKNPVPINLEAHRELRLKPLADGYAFASSTNSVPLALAEFADACLEYPIVFSLDDNQGGMPLALVGLRNAENLFVGDDRRWDANYVPAFVRRYPFVLYEQPDGQAPLVLIDDACAGFNAPDGERLFAEDGSNGPMLTRMLEFLHHFQGQGQFAHDFVARLRKHDLLVQRTIDIKGPNDMSLTMGGFYAVDEQRLLALGDAALLELVRSGDMVLIHAHLLSLANMRNKLLRRLESRLALAQAA